MIFLHCHRRRLVIPIDHGDVVVVVPIKQHLLKDFGFKSPNSLLAKVRREATAGRTDECSRLESKNKRAVSVFRRHPPVLHRSLVSERGVNNALAYAAPPQGQERTPAEGAGPRHPWRTRNSSPIETSGPSQQKVQCHRKWSTIESFSSKSDKKKENAWSGSRRTLAPENLLCSSRKRIKSQTIPLP